MQLRELVAVFESIAPTHFAESWDNVGLLVGDPEQPATKLLLTIDYTADVAAEAAALGCDCVLAYHPPLFSPIKRVTADDESRLIYDAARRGVAIYSPHTALDAAAGGTNDVLADAIGIVPEADGRQSLRLIEPKGSQYKLVTFVPQEAVERVSDALFAAGAGAIGDYTRCSFRSPGTGTFRGEPGKTNPTVGQSGKLERPAEVRVETVLPIARVADAFAALRDAHPYEEPAFDLVQLAAPPDKLGQGRVGRLSRPTPRRELIDRLKQQLGLAHLLVAGPTDGDARTAACCAGAGGDLLDDALRRKADVYVTGELRHHDALRAAAAGTTVVCTLHSNSERVTLRPLAARLAPRLPGISVHVSERDRDPFSVSS